MFKANHMFSNKFAKTNLTLGSALYYHFTGGNGACDGILNMTMVYSRFKNQFIQNNNGNNIEGGWWFKKYNSKCILTRNLNIFS